MSQYTSRGVKDGRWVIGVPSGRGQWVERQSHTLWYGEISR
jgi:hypothetical protein